ncbi:nitroreductase/quinone reductase family protein [Mycobacterium paraterrae]|uniref:Nitroreductase family deazaflavin-dependent oxidoreductase n=1 Tax=Mycobacterium paraterrae TaxID=577492 RepID=A0ABY3VT18_9MYCO|nr:nitroreductase/quinone reductase family protein [Mycobacterium paraterrae]UMB69755.1 nitroreductase family deazaflavin-dependent oxidoreductase [Mycobacterium paraterrae]
MSESDGTPVQIAAFTRRASQDASLLKTLNDGVSEQLRANDGVVVDGPMAGVPLLLLHTVGARSGAFRVNPLVQLDYQGRWFVVGSFGGLDKDPAWVHNLRANPHARVEIGATVHTVTARELSMPERDEIWDALVVMNPTFAEYEKTMTRVMPVFELRR